MKHAHLRTLSFFTLWGVWYGGVLGALAGTLIFPIIGTMYSAPWGIGMGLALGFGLGVCISAYNHARLTLDTDLTAYRRGLSLAVGVVTAFGATALLFATSHGILWNANPVPTRSGFYFSGMGVITIACLLAAFLWGGLSSAYVASLYADRYILRLLRLNALDDDASASLWDTSMTWQAVRNGVASPLFIVLAGLIGFATAWRLDASNVPLERLINWAMEGAFVGALLLVMLCVAIGYFLTFAYRLYGQEYDDSPQAHHRLCMASAALAWTLLLPLFSARGIALMAVVSLVCLTIGFLTARRTLAQLHLVKQKKVEAFA
jgi:hypothetical protein